MENEKALLRPPPLSPVIDEWERYIKTERTLNDYVEDVFRKLVGDEEFLPYVNAVYDAHAVEGSLSADNFRASQMIREAAPDNSPLKKEKLAPINQSLAVVMRRYHKSRKERRQTVGGKVVPDGSQNNVESD